MKNMARYEKDVLETAGQQVALLMGRQHKDSWNKPEGT